jgi:hypothetical protein
MRGSLTFPVLAFLWLAFVTSVLMGAYRYFQWAHPGPVAVRTWYDPTTDPPHGAIHHAVTFQRPGDILVVVHPPGMTCEYCRWESSP